MLFRSYGRKSPIPQLRANGRLTLVSTRRARASADLRRAGVVILCLSGKPRAVESLPPRVASRGDTSWLRPTPASSRRRRQRRTMRSSAIGRVSSVFHHAPQPCSRTGWGPPWSRPSHLTYFKRRERDLPAELASSLASIVSSLSRLAAIARVGTDCV